MTSYTVLDVFLYSKVNSTIGMVHQNIKSILTGERANLPNCYQTLAGICLFHLVTMAGMGYTRTWESIALCCLLCVQFDTNHLYSRLRDIGAMPSYGTCYLRPINSVTRFPMNHYKPSTATSTRSFLIVTKSSFIMNSCRYLPVELTYTSIPSFLRQSTVGTTCSDKPSCQHLQASLRHLYNLIVLCLVINCV